jgi:CRP-like cAMP-binding protein
MQNKWQDNFSLETLASKTIVPLQSDIVWWIDRGIAKTYTLDDDGTVVNLGYWGAGDVIGESLSVSKSCYVKCLTDVNVFFIPLDKCDPLTNAICNHIQQAEKLLYIIRNDNLDRRLWGILQWLGDKFGKEVELGKLINLKVTHQELAETIGTTRVTVTKLIKQLEAKGMISRPRRNSIVLNRVIV